MAAGMPDVRALVPRTPPEGLREWALKTYRDYLDRSGLVYEAEYVEDYGLAQVLDEWSKPKKIKMVRVKCSACGESMLLNWGKSEKFGYGFIHPEDQEGDWGDTVTEAGDEVLCPICGARVLVNKRSAIKGYYVTAECSVMSASVVGEQNFLALTGWTVQNRVYKSGCESLEFLPAEAYVFGPHDCAQLMGWRNSYSGSAGYFISYSADWRQPKAWSERWGETEHIFGLTPELIDGCCLPHCKLDVYMAPRPGTVHYPVPYLRLYQTHHNVEAVLVHGPPRVLDGLMKTKVNAPAWETNSRGLMELPEIDWTQRRPAQMLRMTKDELRMAQGQHWDLLLWTLFARAKEYGEVLTAEDMECVFWLGDEDVAELAGRGPVAKSIRYLLRQCEALETEDEDEDPVPVGIPDVRTLLDYWDMSARLGRDLNDPLVRFPADLIAAHDRASIGIELKEESFGAHEFRVRRRLLAKYSFQADGLLIRPAASQRELTAEGDFLHHCVGTYGKRHAGGETAIFFIRRASRPREPYYTLELDEKNLKVRQNRGMRNCGKTTEVQAFEDKWLAWVRAGAPRGKDGRPVIDEKTRRKEAAA